MGWELAVTVLCGYLLGSVPVSRLVTGRDLRTVGDRNPGYWNAKDQMGRRAALPVFLGDAAKGVAAAALGALLAEPGEWWLAYAGGGAAMIGHAWPVFAGFRGGRSILTFAGAVCVSAPLAAALAIAALVIVWSVTRSFAISARVGVFGFPVVQLFVDGPNRTAATGALMSIIGVRFLMAWRAQPAA
jgi:acyl phosphate:glycerol-3-phosphate acyltransferase